MVRLARLGFPAVILSTALSCETPPPAPGPSKLKSVSAGWLYTCGVTVGGASYCWGDNSVGQLGDSSRTSRVIPVPVAGGLALTAISADTLHTCGVTTGGAAYCWGDDFEGELGNAAPPSVSIVPVAVTGGLFFATISAGGSYTCGATITGTAYCWGDNAYNELGVGTPIGRSSAPVAVAGGHTFSSVSAGMGPSAAHTCGVATAGAAYCWGANYSGELGSGTPSGSATPTAVAGGLTFTELSAGGSHSCGVTIGGAAYCWGRNTSGQLGDGSQSNSSTPVAVAGGLSFAAVSAGWFHTCGLTRAAAVYCWGANGGGQLGTGSQNASSSPVAVAGGLTFVTVSAGATHSCGVTTDGTGYCWGNNSSGQLGNGSTVASSVPVRVAGLP